MIIKTFFPEIDPDLTEVPKEYEGYFERLSYERREKILRLHSPHSKVVSLMAAVFARECIAKVTGIPEKAQSFIYNENGKPAIADVDNFHFNISHSEGCIAFVHSNKPVGIDVERIRSYDIRLPKRFFTEHERSMLDSAPLKDEEFYRIWTLKESYVKMKGSTLAQMIRHIDIYNIRDAEINTIRERGYIITACEQHYS
ncbi:MAG: 4'-phosphopantetheinyl transferase superfamily protein [Ruminococcus sp.]|jgi:4'-phosphopantetheinyl transferase|nr:4'-phosphopantetheinyl transferase superfamily protein [Ruminococcus sp.]